MTWDTVYKIATILIGLGVFGGFFNLIVWVIRLEPRIQSIELNLSRIHIILEQLKEWDGKTERRRKVIIDEI